jgi:hypothetical protein
MSWARTERHEMTMKTNWRRRRRRRRRRQMEPPLNQSLVARKMLVLVKTNPLIVCVRHSQNAQKLKRTKRKTRMAWRQAVPTRSDQE